MSTLSWLEVLLFVTVVVGTACALVAYHMGYQKAEHDQKLRLLAQAREASMSRHPAGKRLGLSPNLRAMKDI